MKPDPTRLLAAAGIETPLIGFYDAPESAAFAPLVEPAKGTRACVFEFYPQWLKGVTLHLSKDNFGCFGAGRSLCGAATRSDDDLVAFLVEKEGLKTSRELMKAWIRRYPPYQPAHGHTLIGPLRPGQEAFLKTITFFVNPDQLSFLMTGAQYHAGPSDPAPVLAPFGSGCGQLVNFFDGLDVPQAVISGTDIAMRQHLPPDLLALTVTKPMFERLCSLDERSFIDKPFWKRVQAARRK